MAPEPTRILVIEDEAAHAEAVSRSLEALEGAQLRVMPSLREYREQGAAWHPDIVLMDLNLPDGRATEVLPDPEGSRPYPIIVMTSYGSEQTAVQTLKSGALDYLVKSPETFRDLPRTLSRLLREWAVRCERKRAEDALREAHQLNGQIIRSAQEGIIVYGTDLRYQVWNPYMERLTGVPADHVLGRLPLEVFPYLLGTPLLESLEKALAGGIPGAVDFACTMPGARAPVWVSDTSAPLRNSRGDIIGIIGTVRDITERKRTEEEQHRLQERMSQIQKLEALGVLVAGVAHNINNVLAAIMGTASLRERSATEARDQEAYAIIGTACRRGRDVVKSLMQFARPSLSSQAPIELHGLISEVRTLLENTTRNRVQVFERFCEEPLWISGDVGSLNHALMNLCLNALDAMPHGGTLTFRTTASEAAWVELAVEDSGEGMPPEILARVMEPFFTTKPVGQGTGLGLSMTHGVIKAHGGTLEIASQPGLGTTVRLRVPRIPPPSGARASERPTPKVGPLKVLLVDDDADVRFLVTRMLTIAGLEARSAGSGEEALQVLRSEGAPDLVILDQNMPGMDGVQTMGRIRALHPEVPILISSGQPDIQDWPSFKAPNVAVISKPFELDELMAKLAQMVPPPA